LWFTLVPSFELTVFLSHCRMCVYVRNIMHLKYMCFCVSGRPGLVENRVYGEEAPNGRTVSKRCLVIATFSHWICLWLL
jgi:hypothetical protein